MPCPYFWAHGQLKKCFCYVAIELEKSGRYLFLQQKICKFTDRCSIVVWMSCCRWCFSHFLMLFVGVTNWETHGFYIIKITNTSTIYSTGTEVVCRHALKNLHSKYLSNYQLYLGFKNWIQLHSTVQWWTVTVL